MTYKDEIEYAEDNLDDLLERFLNKHEKVKDMWEEFIFDAWLSYRARLQEAMYDERRDE